MELELLKDDEDPKKEKEAPKAAPAAPATRSPLSLEKEAPKVVPAAPAAGLSLSLEPEKGSEDPKKGKEAPKAAPAAPAARSSLSLEKEAPKVVPAAPAVGKEKEAPKVVPAAPSPGSSPSLEIQGDGHAPKEAPKRAFVRPPAAKLYQPALAMEFFKSVGKPERFEGGKAIFVENEGAANVFAEGSRMYLLVDGEVSLTVAKKEIGTVSKGEIFGEMASITQLPRTASAMAKTVCDVISLDATQFQAAMVKSPEFALMLMNIIIARLRETIANLTGGGKLTDKDEWNRAAVFDRKLLADLVKEFEEKPAASHPAKKVITKEGDGGIFSYIVLEGVVSITIDGKPVEKVGPGGMFGEMALVNQGPRNATATTDTACSLLAINRVDFMNLVKSKPAFAMSLLKALSQRLRAMTAKYK